MFAREQPADEGAAPRLGRDRASLITAVAVIGLGLVAWVGVIADASKAGMPGMETPPSAMDHGDMADGTGSSVMSAAAFLVAWGVMMAAMMLPSAAPMIALYGAIHRHSGRTGQGGISVVAFSLLYLVAWLLFGVPVYGAQLAVDALVESSPAVAGLLPYALAIVLIVAGAYQLSPLKTVCLRACRSPLGFLMARWRAGYLGTLRLGVAHALYCIGCCWALMVVLVAAGAMGLHWVLLVAALVALEKLAPGGVVVARAAGVALVVLGLLVAVEPSLYGVLRGMTM